MQLFRQQAIDHQHRLYGEVLLVQPLRWSLIGGLLLILVSTTCLFLIFGTYSPTIKASGTSRSDGRIDLIVPVAAIAQIAPGQVVRMTLADDALPAGGVLHGVILSRADSTGMITAQLAAPGKGEHANGALLGPGIALDAHIVLPARSLLQWLVAPPAVATQP